VTEPAIEAELRLLDRSVRRRPDEVAALLDPAFVEFGASGRRWDRAAIIEALSGDAADDPPIEASEVTATELAPGVVLVTYVSSSAGRRANRSSIWRETPSGWRILFHQGTLLPG
jgi:hypothetical protein